jgi:hypothetical protein
MSCNMLCCVTLRKLGSCAPTGEGNNQSSNAIEESAEVQALLTRIALISNEEGGVLDVIADTREWLCAHTNGSLVSLI